MRIADEMQVQAKALGDPSRFRLFRHIVESPAPVTVAELTELLGFNHNAIRQHLDVLTTAGLIVESDERRTTPGRPRKHYTPRQDALSAFRSVSGSHHHLALLLLRVATSDRSPYDVGFAAACAADDDRGAADESGDPHKAVDALLRQLTVSGFEPTQCDDEITLANCPFADVAAEGPEVVCELHRGLIDGQLAAYGGSLAATLTAQDPHRAGCRVTISSSGEAAPA